MRSFFLLKCGERSNAALAGISKIVQIQSRQKLGCTSTRWAERQRIIGANQIVSQQKNSRHPIPQAEQLFKPKPRNGGVKGQSPLCSLGGQRGPFSHVREWPPYPHLHMVWGNHNLVICTPAVFSINFLVPTVSNATSSSASPPIGVTEMTSPSPNVLWWIWSPEES